MRRFARIFLAVLLCLVRPTYADNSTVFDTIGTASDNAVAISKSFSLTVGTGSNRALIAECRWAGSPVSPTAVWDSGGTNQSMAIITQQATTGSAQTTIDFGLVAPTSGAHTLLVSWTGSLELIMQAFAVTGADQTGGSTTFANATTTNGTSAAPAITIVGSQGSMVVGAVVCCSAQGLNTLTQTNTFLVDGAGLVAGAGARANGGASVTFTGALTGSDIWAMTAFEIKPAFQTYLSPGTGTVIRGGKVTMQ